MKQVLARIISNIEVMPGYHLLCVEASAIAAAASPGQFVMIKCNERLMLRRPLSIHKVDDSQYVNFLFAVPAKISDYPESYIHRPIEKRTSKGKGTLWLSQRQKGEELDILGPMGNGFFIEPATKNLLLVAGGIGVAPLVFLAQLAIDHRKSVTLLLGARTDAGLYPVEHLPPGVRTFSTTEDGSRGRKGMVSDILPDYIDWADQIYACGPVAMYQAMADRMQKQKKIKLVQISLEVRMGCGLGACYSCSIKTNNGIKQVCRDGPVFDINEIMWQEVKI